MVAGTRRDFALNSRCHPTEGAGEHVDGHRPRRPSSVPVRDGVGERIRSHTQGGEQSAVPMISIGGMN